MRRKSERAASSKKAKSSPERKPEPVKRTRSRRSKKPSTSSEDESVNEETLVSNVKVAEIDAQPPPKTPVKDVNPEESQEQVWQVKSTLSPGDTGDIQKLKICLTRPPSTPERVDRSPRSKRKSRATSSSDAHSVDGTEEKRKSRHRKKSSRESKDESEKSQDSQSEEIKDTPLCVEQPNTNEALPSDKSTEDVSALNNIQDESRDEIQCEINNKQQETVADTTVDSPKTDSMETIENSSLEMTKTSLQINVNNDNKSPREHKDEDIKMQVKEDIVGMSKEQVSNIVESAVPSEEPHSPNDNGKVNNDHDVLEIECTQYETEKDPIKDLDDNQELSRGRTLERFQSTKSEQEDTITSNGPPIVVNRKRKWGSRPNKIVSQKSLTISTDILKDIIPDVKPVDMTEVIEEKKAARRVDVRERIEMKERYEKPILPKIVIDNSDNVEKKRDFNEKENLVVHEPLTANRKISIVKHDDVVEVPLSPPRNKQSCILYITNLVRPFTIPQLKNLLQRTGRIESDGFWINKIKSKCFVKYENEDQAVETRHALHGVTWPVSNPKSLQVDFSTDEAFEKARENEDNENSQTSTIPGTVEDWLREQDQKREKGELEAKPWERKNVREWDVGKGEKVNAEKFQHTVRDERLGDKRRHRTPERSPEPAKKFKRKEEEAPAKLLDDLFRKTKATPCIYWLPLSAETIAIKEEQRRKHMAEHERRLTELRRPRRH